MYRVFQQYNIKVGNLYMGTWFLQSIKSNQLTFFRHEDGKEIEHLKVNPDNPTVVLRLFRDTPLRF